MHLLCHTTFFSILFLLLPGKIPSKNPFQSSEPDVFLLFPQAQPAYLTCLLVIVGVFFQRYRHLPSYLLVRHFRFREIRHCQIRMTISFPGWNWFAFRPLTAWSQKAGSLCICKLIDICVCQNTTMFFWKVPLDFNVHL